MFEVLSALYVIAMSPVRWYIARDTQTMAVSEDTEPYVAMA